jgi:hypothetical protein
VWTCEAFKSVSVPISQQERTGHRSNATLVAGVFTISYTNCQKRGLLETFWGPFEIFCMDGRRGLLTPVRLWFPNDISRDTTLKICAWSSNCSLFTLRTVFIRIFDYQIWGFQFIRDDSVNSVLQTTRKPPDKPIVYGGPKWCSGWLLLQRSRIRIPGKSWSFLEGLALDWQSSLLKNKPCLEWPICGFGKVIDLLTYMVRL